MVIVKQKDMLHPFNIPSHVQMLVEEDQILWHSSTTFIESSRYPLKDIPVAKPSRHYNCGTIGSVDLNG